ncbi:Ger(x)C family spore germination protein [Pullulanibacillus sp. KACC 23026]|uniref:Ger(x)C family spore germination protein n=1 Tax=Pullulanibacillus sp. KACC 23026 TaxID=3028315 RepID=UPI0023B1C7F9|nr:Ger(x)C family spore germination protein [Pullulanibacillus sp. KACC 23026]WEG14676.1 Ger(x)C family spore germination protein [Pullulanibacillus sp. KACC 23026]
MKGIKPAIFFAVFCLFLFDSGCSPFTENNIIEEIAPVIFLSVKNDPSGQLLLTTLVPPLEDETKQSFSSTVKLIKQGEKEFNLNYYRELKMGQLRMVFINKNLASDGIRPLINTLFTDPSISPRLYIVVVDGNFEAYLKNQLEKQQNLDYYLYRMLKHYEKYNQGDMSIVNLHQFMKQLYSPLQDPILPVFKANGERLSYDGTALFDGDKLKTTIHEMDDQLFQLLGNDRYVKLFALPKQQLVLGQVRSKVNCRLDVKTNVLHVTDQISGRLEEYQGNEDLLNQNELSSLTKEIEMSLEHQTTALLEKMQKEHVDPLQFGLLTTSPISPRMTTKQWKEQWENTKIDVHFSLKIQPITTGNKM